jgi:hypothetical protein
MPRRPQRDVRAPTICSQCRGLMAWVIDPEDRKAGSAYIFQCARCGHRTYLTKSMTAWTPTPGQRTRAARIGRRRPPTERS